MNALCPTGFDVSLTQSFAFQRLIRYGDSAALWDECACLERLENIEEYPETAGLEVLKCACWSSPWAAAAAAAHGNASLQRWIKLIGSGEKFLDRVGVAQERLLPHRGRAFVSSPPRLSFHCLSPVLGAQEDALGSRRVRVDAPVILGGAWQAAAVVVVPG